MHERASEWDLSRFLPTLHALARQLHAGDLSRDDYPALGGDGRAAGAAAAGGSGSAAEGATAGAGAGAGAPKVPGKSARSARTGGAGGWAKRGSFCSEVEMGGLAAAAGGGGSLPPLGGGAAGAGGGAGGGRVLADSARHTTSPNAL